MPQSFNVVPDWSAGFIAAYESWTIEGLGAGHGKQFEIEHLSRDWNSAFIQVLARAFTKMSEAELVGYILRLSDVPDRSLFAVVDQMIYAVDLVFFNGGEIELSAALKIRTVLADLVVATAGWRREQQRTDMVVERNIGAAISKLFFNTFGGIGSSSCYLREGVIDRIDAFFPLLGALAQSGPVPLTAVFVMNLLEVSPRPGHQSFFLQCALSWLRRQPIDSQIWESGLGVRLVKWIEAVLLVDASLMSSAHPERHLLDEMLSLLVQIGVAPARSLEIKLSRLAS
jgi:hypothetical protein